VQIRRLKIKRFRGIKELAWCPGPGLNCLTGPADAGKSTILEAISLVLSPAPGRVASEYDYFQGAVAEGFSMEALVGKLDDELLSAWPVAPLYTWMADTQNVQADPDPAGESVLWIRAQGTEEPGDRARRDRP
jgi:putative ATP-dependent endonuclease of OLD family